MVEGGKHKEDQQRAEFAEKYAGKSFAANHSQNGTNRSNPMRSFEDKSSEDDAITLDSTRSGTFSLSNFYGNTTNTVSDSSPDKQDEERLLYRTLPIRVHQFSRTGRRTTTTRLRSAFANTTHFFNMRNEIWVPLPLPRKLLSAHAWSTSSKKNRWARTTCGIVASVKLKWEARAKVT